MKKHRRYFGICLMMCTLFLSGCGTKLYEMTAEEKDLIVHSAAYIVAKNNMQQKDGAANVLITEDEAGSESSEAKDTQDDTQTGDIQAGDTQTTDSVEAVSLAEVIGHAQDLKIEYLGSEQMDSYTEGSVYHISADAGKTLYVMKFRLTNITEADVYVDNLTINPTLKLITANGKVRSEKTFLSADFCTYMGTIGAGQSVETVLLFQLPKADAEQLTAPELQFASGKVNKTVKF